MLTPKEIGAGTCKKVFPVKIDYSALIEGGFGSSNPIGTNARISFWFKPTKAVQTTLLNDQTAHYHIDITKTGATVAVSFNGIWYTNYDGPVGTMFHNLIENVLTFYVGYTKGYCSELYCVDGSTAATFGKQSNLVTGLWIPKNPGILVYGTNGCHLDFANASELGEDVSGNNNDWAINGSPAQMLDTPTNNYCTLNPLDWIRSKGTTSLSNGNLTMLSTDGGTRGTIGVRSGKFYYEVYIDDTDSRGPYLGIIHERSESSSASWCNQAYNGYSYTAGLHAVAGDGDSWGVGDTIGIAIDLDAATPRIHYYKNGVANGYSDIPNDFTLIYPSLWYVSQYTANFGSTGFTHAPPEGHLSLCTANLPDPTILKSSTVADLVMRVGTGANTSVAGLEFGPDFVNVKDRDNLNSWMLFDTARGATNWISTDTTSVEYVGWLSSLAAFNSDGYDLSTAAGLNGSGSNFLDLCLKAGVDQGFEIVTYAGQNNAQTLAHSLGKTPTFMIFKNLTTDSYWAVYHKALGVTQGLYLNYTGAAFAASSLWNNTEPNSTHFTVGYNTQTSVAGDNFVVYLFTDSDIFRAFSYTGNGLSDGPFVNLGGKPLGIPFMKNSNFDRDWINQDSARSPFNPVSRLLQPNRVDPDYNNPVFNLNFTSSGFKVANNSGGWNRSGDLMVGLAILESTKYSNAY